MTTETIPQWRTMDSAPKDGTRFLAWIANGKITIAWFMNNRAFVAEGLGSGDTSPTHWMPLPLPPAPPGVK